VPRIAVAPLLSRSVHAPLADLPLELGEADQVPLNVRPVE
jgi:hypothetical protein